MKLGNLKIGTKLIGGFLIVVTLMLAISIVSYLTLQNAKTNQDTLYQDRLIPIEWLGSVNSDVYNIRGDVFKYALLVDERTANEQSINALKANINKEMDAYRALPLTDQEKAGLAAFDTNWAIYQSEVDKCLALSKAGRQEEMLQNLTDGGSTANARKAVDKSLAELIKLNILAADNLDKNTDSQSSSGITIIIILASFSIVLAMVLAVILSRNITGPINKIKTGLKKIALGDVSETVDLTTKDEVGQMAVSYTEMQNYLKEMANIAHNLAEGNVRQVVRARSEKDILGQSCAEVTTSLNSLIGEMNHMSDEHNRGDIDANIETDKFKGAYKEVAQGVNSMVNGHITVKKKAMACIAEFGRGNFEAPLEKFPGKKAFINDTIEQVRANLKALIADANMLCKAAVEGKLSTRADASRHQGDFSKIVQGVNDTLDAVIKPVNEAAAVLERLSVNDLSIRVAGEYKGDHARIKESLNLAIDNLTRMINKLKQSASQLSAASVHLTTSSNQASQATTQVATASQQMAKGAQDQSNTSQQTAKSVEQLTTVIGQIATSAMEQQTSVKKAVDAIDRVSEASEHAAISAGQAAEGAKKAAETATSGAEKAEKTMNGMEKIRVSTGEVSKKIEELGNRSSEIGKIVAVIDDIAAQTNLLALNAAIEAARAGEQGRGFAVVSDEVRKLAERTATATKEIAGLIGSVQKGVNEAMQVMTGGSQAVEDGYNLAKQAGDALQQIVKAADSVNTQIEKISANANQVKASVTELVKIVGNVGSITEQNTAATEEMSASASEVSKSIETVAGIAEENSAATEELSASAEQMSSQVEEIVASSHTLEEMSVEIQKMIGGFKVNQSSVDVV